MGHAVLDSPVTSNATDAERCARYDAVFERIKLLLGTEEGGDKCDWVSAMSTVACELSQAFSYFSWTGFYRRVSRDRLAVGPYQGTLGCLAIPMGKGVCGAAARTKQTQLVPDVHAYPGHIACDSRTASEIVVPVLRGGGSRGGGSGGDSGGGSGGSSTGIGSSGSGVDRGAMRPASGAAAAAEAAAAGGGGEQEPRRPGAVAAEVDEDEAGSTGAGEGGGGGGGGGGERGGWQGEGEVLAVLDIDSLEPGAFRAESDQVHLERLCDYLGRMYGSSRVA